MANTARLVIDPIARKISTKYEKIRLVQQDNNSMRITFEMPRVVRGHDMSNCSTVEVHYDNISFDRKKVNSDIYTVTDIIVAPEDEETINFSWLVSRAATQLEGHIEFSLHFGCTEDASLEYAWHTTTYSGIVVLAGKHNTNTIVKQYPDAFDELRKDIYKKIEEAVSNAKPFDIVHELGDREDAAISQKGAKKALECKLDKPEEGVEFVKTTDYATPSKRGIVMPVAANGTGVNAYGQLYLVEATGAELSAKTNHYKPVTPSNLDQAVKVGATTNTIALTDAEQKSACDWMGAVAKSQVQAVGGIKIVNGILQLDSANEGEIASKRAVNAPLKPSNIDSVVKTGITTNTKVLTEAEKQSAQEWLGVKSELDTIKAAVDGRLYDYVVDDSEESSKIPPANALRYAQLVELGDILVYGEGKRNALGANGEGVADISLLFDLTASYDPTTRIITLNGSFTPRETTCLFLALYDMSTSEDVHTPQGSYTWTVTAEHIGGTTNSIVGATGCGVYGGTNNGLLTWLPLPSEAEVPSTFTGNGGVIKGYYIQFQSTGYENTFDNYQLRINAGYEPEIAERREVGQIVVRDRYDGEILRTYPATAPQTLDLEGDVVILFEEADGSCFNPAESTVLYQVKVVV